MTTLTSLDKKLLGLACLEELEYYTSPEAMAVSVGGPISTEKSEKIKAALGQASGLLRKKYLSFIDILEQAVARLNGTSEK